MDKTCKFYIILSPFVQGSLLIQGAIQDMFNTPFKHQKLCAQTIIEELNLVLSLTRLTYHSTAIIC